MTTARRIPISTPSGTFEVQVAVDRPTARRCGSCCCTADPAPLTSTSRSSPTTCRSPGSSSSTTTSSGPSGATSRTTCRCGTCPASSTRWSRCARPSASTRDNFFLLGHSWGGILGIEYALKHGQHLKGLIVSNMMASIPAYNRYAHDVLMPPMDQAVLARILELEDAEDYDNPAYEELLMEHFYVFHVLRRPVEEWPECVVRSFDHINKQVYVRMQGPSEMGAKRHARRVGSLRRPRRRHRPDAGDRGEPRHHGPGLPAGHGQPAPERAATCTAPTAATWRCTTTPMRT